MSNFPDFAFSRVAPVPAPSKETFTPVFSSYVFASSGMIPASMGPMVLESFTSAQKAVDDESKSTNSSKKAADRIRALANIIISPYKINVKDKD